MSEHPSAKEGDDPIERPPVGAAEQARAAMKRARESARVRGSDLRSARQAHRDRSKRQREAGVDPAPYGRGRDEGRFDEEITRLFDRMGWTEQVEIGAVTARWREVVGDAIADHSKDVSFEAGRLTLRATSTAWAEQLTIMSGEIRHRLNEAVGRTIVTEVTVVGPSGRSWIKGPRTVKGRGPRDTYG